MAKTKSLPALDAANVDPKVEFFLTASHQLKSPVAIMQWCLQSLTEMPVDPAARKLVGKALEQANNMSALVADMLQVFRLMHPNSVQTLESVKMNPIIDAVFAQYEPVAHNKGVHLVKGELENLPIVFGREVLLKQAVINLIDNAIKYSKGGGHVTVSARTHDHMVEIHVADEGIGIAEAEQGRMFTEFFRGEEAKEVAYEGTGLGLVLVKHIMESIGGSISFKSALHKGTDFTLKMPYKS